LVGFPATRITGTTMAEAGGQSVLLRLTAWLSPAFPIGSFSYSSGLERAVHDGLVASADDLGDWIGGILQQGGVWNDAVLLAEAWRRTHAGGGIRELAELATAMAGSAERHMETTLQGAAFRDAAGAWGETEADDLPADVPYCVAVGAISGRHGVALDDTLAVFLQAWASNLIQAAIRLSVLGQKQGLALLSRLEPQFVETAARAARSTLDDLGSATFTAEIAAMNHETQHSRLFRS